jgi:hypothetical protein
VVAVVRDLFFASRFGETARLLGVVLDVARSPRELPPLLVPAPSLVILDLTVGDWDYGELFGALESRAPGTPILGYTTHVLARQTRPLHGRCRKVLTRESLTRELPGILGGGLAAVPEESLDPAPAATPGAGSPGEGA